MARLRGSDLTADAWRASLVDRLVADGIVRSAPVEAALRAVERHRFIPEVSLAEAYADEALVIKRDVGGTATSSLSQPTMVAIMLEQLAARAGDRVLEIGSGTGYNAALLAAIVGDNGHVTTIEYDEWVADRARVTLSEMDSRVEVITGDGEAGYARYAPFDRIIVTVGAWDVAPAWWSQLGPDGRLVVPLRVGGLQRSIAFRPVGAERWRSTSIETCGFVPIQGAGAFEARTLRLSPSAVLHVDDAVPMAPGLSRALGYPSALEWTGVESGDRDLHGDLELWLLTAVRALGRLSVSGADLIAPVPTWGALAVISGETFAYLSRRPFGPSSGEFGIAAYGPEAAELAAGIAAEVQAFSRASRAGVRPVIDARPSEYPEGSHGALSKRHTRLDIEWVRLAHENSA